MNLKWFMFIPSIYLVTGDTTLGKDSKIPKSSQPRFKRYEYPKPHSIWTPVSTGYNQGSIYNYQSNQADTNGYYYDKPYKSFAEVGGSFISADQRIKPHNRLFSNDPARLVESQRYIAQNVHSNKELPYRVHNQDNLRFIAQQNSRNKDVSQTGSLVTPNVGELLSPRRKGDDQGAFIDSDIFGADIENLNITIGPTGLFLPKSTGVQAFAKVIISCDQPYQKPPTPDFSEKGNRISEIKCYEYIWELKTRDDKEQYDKQCNKMRSKRSHNGWRQQSWYPQYEYQYRPQAWPPQYDSPWNYQSWYNQTKPANTGNDIPEKIKENTPKSEPQVFPAISFNPADPEEFPHMAAIGWRGVNEEYVFKCGGSLISNNFVLTAAHCTASGPDPSITDIIPRIVRIGDTNIGFRPNGQTFNQKRSRRQTRDPGRIDVGIINIIKYERYNPNVKYFDIALLQLEYNLEFNKHLQPACLFTNPNTNGRIKKAVAAGWGIVDLVTSRTTLDLQAGELDIIDTPTCNRLLRPSFGKKFSGVVDHQICAGKLSGGADVCQGDSGGPLQLKIKLPYKNQGSMHSILGIISAGAGCARPDTPGVYTKVTSFLDWIERYVWT